MTTEAIREALAGATAYLSEHPDEARYTDSVATAVVVEGLRVRVTGAGDEALETDMPSSVGGGGAAPSPGWLLRAAQASCAATLIAMRAVQLGVSLEHLEVTVDSESDDRGILGIDPSIPAGPLSSRVIVRLRATGDATADLEEIARWGVDHCPVVDAVRRAVPLSVEVETA